MRPAPRPSVVYVVRNDRDALPRRMRELSRLCKGRVTCLATFPGDDTLERHLHAHCAADLVAGEWFRPSERVTLLIEEMRRKSARERPAETFPRTDSPFAPVLPPWVAVQPREGLAVCGCTRTVHGVTYAAGACAVCHGAGVLSAHTEAA